MKAFFFVLMTASLIGLGTFCEAANLLDGLVVYFPFDEGKGNIVKDHSEKGNDGERKGGTEWTTGQYDKGLRFDGNDGIVEVKDNDTLHFQDGLTITAWMNPTLKGDEWQLIGSKGLDAQEFFEVLLSPKGFIWMGWLFSKGRVVPAQSPSKVKPNVWQHVAVSWDAKKFWTVYLDGEVLIDYPKQDDKLVPNNFPLLVGREINLKRFYNGVIDEFALFSRGLTKEEIRQVMEGLGKFLSVEPSGKLSITWGNIKRNR